jgi:hypothetical protein
MTDWSDSIITSRLGRAREGTIRMDPAKFYAVVDLMRGGTAATLEALKPITDDLESACAEADLEVEQLAKVSREVDVEERRSTKFKNPFAEPGDDKDPLGDLRIAAKGENFLRTLLDVSMYLQAGFHAMREACRNAVPGPVVMAGRGPKRERWVPENFEDMQRMMAEISMNEGTVGAFMSGVFSAEAAEEGVTKLGYLLGQRLDNYYRMLLHRHSSEGVKIHGDPVTTDVALAVFENVDSDGEIQDGRKPDEISAYSHHKAEIICRAMKEERVSEFVKHPTKLIEFIKQNLTELQALATTLALAAMPAAEALRRVLGPGAPKKPRAMGKGEFDLALKTLDILDPCSVKYKEKTGLLSAEERFALNFKNETLAAVADRLTDGYSSTKGLIQYILERKAELRDYYRDENSFYVCRVGAGNPFLGTAPGELEVVPGTRPVVDISEISGAGFDEVREFYKQVEASGKWYEIFLATSPSRTADKSNVLLVGPMGCGKTEILRAVGGDKRSIGIFAVGSDFLTCWKGEAEKNPKRLFEAAHKLQRESKKHVHILIDEIDTILNDDKGPGSYGSTSLVTEFQNLMDGVVHYPSISVWGCTNRVDRIPMPMIRRFSKVLVVGELSQEDRIDLLKRFSAFMPGDVPKTAWADLAKRLEGATGDVVRKIVDHVWRKKMTGFVEKKPADAEKVKDWLENCQNQRFTLAAFTEDQRKKLHEMLRPHVSVTAKDLEDSIEMHLETVAVRSEIQTAVETYARSHAFLTQLRATKNGKGRREAEADAEEHDRT